MSVKWQNTIKWIGFISIFILGLLVRFWHFPANPPALNWDEVSMGYNAYSILKTGRDEFGNYLPKYIRSLDDYKTPVYTYVTVASVGIFGFNDFAVRIPSAFLGVLTVALLYICVTELYDDELPAKKSSADTKRLKTAGRTVALLSAALLGIMPWHVQFSRMAAEANVGLFFLVAGVTFFLLGIHKKLWFLPVSIVSFGLSAYSYRSCEVIAPIMGAMLVVLYWRTLLSKRTMAPVVVSGILVLCIGLFMAQDVFSSTTNIRVKGTSVFDSSDTYNAYFQNGQERVYDYSVHQGLLSGLLHNSRLVTVGIIAKGYLTHFSPAFWFFDYDQKLHFTPSVGLLYLWVLLFMPVGMYYLTKKISKKSIIIIVSWIVISPIPASVTIDVPHAIRVLPMVIPFMIITAAGMYAVYEKFQTKKMVVYVYEFVIFLCIIFSAVHFFHQYDTHLPYERSEDWVYGRQQLVQYVESIQNQYKQVIVSTSLDWPYIFFLYYSKYDPAKYLAQGGTVSGGFAEENNQYDIYQFKRLDSLQHFQIPGKDSTLFVGLRKEFPDKAQPLHVIRYLNGETAIWIVDGKRL